MAKIVVDISTGASTPTIGLWGVRQTSVWREAKLQVRPTRSESMPDIATEREKEANRNHHRDRRAHSHQQFPKHFGSRLVSGMRRIRDLRATRIGSRYSRSCRAHYQPVGRSRKRSFFGNQCWAVAGLCQFVEVEGTEVLGLLRLAVIAAARVNR